MEIDTCYSLREIREKIDIIDKEIVSLLVKRGGYVQQAVKFKNDYSNIVDKKRISEIIENVTRYSKDLNFDSSVIEKIYLYLIQVFIQFEKKTFMNN